MVGARVRRQQVAYARRLGLSSRRACAVLSVARSTLGYESRLRQRDAPALAVMRETRGPVSAVRLPEDPGLSRAPGAPDEYPTDLSSVAPGGPARAATAHAPAGSLPAARDRWPRPR